MRKYYTEQTMESIARRVLDAYRLMTTKPSDSDGSHAPGRAA